MLQDNNTYPVSLSPTDSAVVSVAFLPTSLGLKSAGQSVYERSCHGKSILDIEITGLSNGIYSLQCLTTDGSVMTVPVAVAK